MGLKSVILEGKRVYDFEKNRLLIAEQIKRQELSLQNDTNILPDFIFIRHWNGERAFVVFISH